MEFKKVFIIVIFIILIIVSCVGIYIFIESKDRQEEITEYTPQEEISEQQMRQTIISLYFISGTEVVPEARSIDVKELVNNPYEKILNLLIEGPKNENLKNSIPTGTKINKLEKQGENLIIDFSKEFIENFKDDTQKKLAIKCIVKTVTELTEINGIKILINGGENENLKNENIEFFTRESEI